MAPRATSLRGGGAEGRSARAEGPGLAAGLRASLGSPLLLLWALFIVIVPFYVFASGRPQPAHVAAVLLLACVALDRGSRVAVASLRIAAPLLLFVVYALVVNLVWAIVRGNPSLSPGSGHLIQPVFYLFNASILLAGLALHARHGDRFLAATAAAVFVSMLVQAGGSFAVGDAGSFRQSLWFNNPNQLGYYALLSATIFSLLARRLPLSSVTQGVFFAATAYIAVLSLSRAAMLSVALLAAFTLWTRLRTAAIAALALVAVDALVVPDAEYAARVEERIASASGTADEGLAARGYDRIPNHPEYWMFGAGEGDESRFDSVLDGELHSTLGTVFFSYGIPGSLLFAIFIVRATRGHGVRILALLAPAAVYNLTHQGLRFSLAWVMIAALVCLRAERRRDRAPLPARGSIFAAPSWARGARAPTSA